MKVTPPVGSKRALLSRLSPLYVVVVAGLLFFWGRSVVDAQRGFAQAEKLHPHLVRLLEERGPVKGWVFFGDKGLSDEADVDVALDQARRELSPRALARRSVRRRWDGLVDYADLPVAAEHVEAVLATGVELSVESRWLNAISVRGNRRQFEAIGRLPFVDRVQPVRRGRLIDGDREQAPVEETALALDRGAAFYGGSFEQLEQLNLVAVHQRGFTAEGVVIGILDTGFHLGHEAFNQVEHPVDVIASYDFVNDDDNVGIEAGDPSSQHSHGTYILGTLGAYLPDELVGAAYDASFVLAKTEDTEDEYEQEEDFYVAGLEFIESHGADVATSSLGYIDWYVQEDLDGVSAVTTQAVNIATGNGLICCTAAGNSGHDADPVTSALIAPADSFEVLTVGAVDSAGVIAGFSSDGPSADGRVKPELLARGISTATVCAFTDVDCTTAVNGTSLSTPVLAGAVACLVQAYPEWGVGQMRQRLMRTGDWYQTNGVPDPLFVYGHGVPDLELAGFDCNMNGFDDADDVGTGASRDCNRNGFPDECDIADGVSNDTNADGKPDECRRRRAYPIPGPRR